MDAFAALYAYTFEQGPVAGPIHVCRYQQAIWWHDTCCTKDVPYAFNGEFRYYAATHPSDVGECPRVYMAY